MRRWIYIKNFITVLILLVFTVLVNLMNNPNSMAFKTFRPVSYDEFGEQQTNEKIVFLTFDDGPSPNNTLKILDVLKYLKEQGYSFKTFDEITLCEKEYLEKEKIMNK